MHAMTNSSARDLRAGAMDALSRSSRTATPCCCDGEAIDSRTHLEQQHSPLLAALGADDVKVTKTSECSLRQ